MSTVGKGARDLGSLLIRTPLATQDRIPDIPTMIKDTLQVGEQRVSTRILIRAAIERAEFI